MKKSYALIASFVAVIALILSLWPTLLGTTSLKQFTVSYETGTELNINSDVVYEGSSIRLPSLTRTGYSFDGWSLTSDGTLVTDPYKVESNVTLYAQYTVQQVEVEQFVVYLFNTITNEYQTVTADKDAVITLPSRLVDGYTFLGWFDSALPNATAVSNSFTVTENTILYTGFVADEVVPTYLVTLVNILEGTVDQTTYTSGDALDLPLPEVEGYSFSGWFDSNALNGILYTNSNHVQSDLTLYAQFTLINEPVDTYTVYLFNTVTKEYDTVTAEKDEIISLDTLSEVGYIFNGWMDPSDNSTYTTTYQVTENVVLYTNFYAVIPSPLYTVTLVDFIAGTVDQSTYTEEQEIDLPTPEVEGYTFVGWFDSFLESANPVADGTMVEADVHLYAKYIQDEVPNYYSVYLFNSLTNEYVALFAEADEVINLTTLEEDGFTFNGWLDSSDNLYTETFTVTSDVVLFADFTPDSVASTVNVVLVDFNNGTVMGSTYEEGDNLELPSPTFEGYIFDGWFTSLNESAVQVENNAVVTSNLLLYAKFTALNGDQLTVTFYTNGGEPIDPITVTSGDTLSLPENPSKFGTVFVGWIYDVSFNGLKFDYTVFDPETPITSNLSLYAFYSYVIPDEAYYLEQVYTYDVYGNSNVFLGYYIYDFDEDLISEYAYNENDYLRDLVLPTEIDGQKIIGIAQGAFDGFKLSNVIVPEGYRFIGESAFSFSEIDNLYLPSTLNSIDTYAFQYTHINQVHFDNGSNLTTIGYQAFRGSYLGDFILPRSVASIDEWAFGNTDFNSFSIEENSRLISIGENAFYNASISSITLPSSLRSIGPNAFGGTYLNTITIPASVTYIGYYAFANTYIETVVWESNNRMKFEYTMFDSTPYNSNKETSDFIIENNVLVKFTPQDTDNTVYDIVIPEGVEYIHYSAFSLDFEYTINSLSFPSTLKEIADNAFTSQIAEGIHFKEIPSFEGIESIGSWVFQNVVFENKDTAPLIIPSSLRHIGYNPFGYAKFNEVIIEAPDYSLYTEGSLLQQNTLSKVTFEEGVTDIGRYFLYGDNTIEEVVIPSTLKSIDEFALNTDISTFTLSTVAPEIQVVGYQAVKFDSTYFSTQTGDFVKFYNVALKNLRNLTGSENYVFNPNPNDITITTIGWEFTNSINPMKVVSIDFTGIKYINQEALYFEQSTLDLTIPNTVEYLDPYFFRDYDGVVQKIEINAPLTEVWARYILATDDEKLFYNSIFQNYHRNSENYSADENGLVISGNILLDVQNPSNDLVIPEGIEIIIEGALDELNINSITLPSTLKVIAWNSFNGTVLNEPLIIPSNVKYIGFRAFSSTTFEGGIEFEDASKLLFVHKNAFDYSSVLDADENGFVTVGPILLNYQGGFSELNVPEGIEVIAYHAVYNKYVVSPNDLNTNFPYYINLPSTLKVIVTEAFLGDNFVMLNFAPDTHLTYAGSEIISKIFPDPFPFTDVVSPDVSKYSYLNYIDFLNPQNQFMVLLGQ